MMLLDHSTTSRTATTQAAPEELEVAWRLADTDFWVASYNGYFGGTIDRNGDHFYVRDTFAQYLGDFGDLVAAQLHLERHLGRLLFTKLSDLP